MRVWMAPRDIIPGSNWAESITAAIREARVLVLIFSSSANASETLWRELGYAVSHGKPVIAFRIESVQPSGEVASLLAAPHWVDAFPPPLEPHADRLAALLRRMFWPSVSANAPAPGASGGSRSGGGSASSGFSWPRRESAPTRAPARSPARPLELDVIDAIARGRRSAPRRRRGLAPKQRRGAPRRPAPLLAAVAARRPR